MSPTYEDYEELPPRMRAKQDQIRAAAQELFLERGFAGTSTDAISSEAGVSKETLYRHFPSKEELLADCLDHLVADFSMGELFAADGSQPINDRDDLRNALLGLAQGLVENLMQPDYLALARVIITETPRLPQLGNIFRSAVPENAFRSITNLLEKAQRAQVARVADAEAAARTFVGPLLTYVLIDGLLVGEGPIRRPQPDRIEAIVDLYLQAITTPRTP